MSLITVARKRYYGALQYIDRIQYGRYSIEYLGFLDAVLHTGSPFASQPRPSAMNNPLS